MSLYQKNSPYFTTSIVNGYLDVASPRNIIAESDDIEYVVPKDYEYRPDMLAYDLYNDVGLWWVFAARNKNVLKDPVFDLVSGVRIYLPKLSNIQASLGI
jgi:hypothetical protein